MPRFLGGLETQIVMSHLVPHYVRERGDTMSAHWASKYLSYEPLHGASGVQNTTRTAERACHEQSASTRSTIVFKR
jgi:hypothetical protein